MNGEVFIKSTPWAIFMTIIQVSLVVNMIACNEFEDSQNKKKEIQGNSENSNPYLKFDIIYLIVWVIFFFENFLYAY
jgi:hypothetical protein